MTPDQSTIPPCRRRAPIIFQPENVFIVSITESNGQSVLTLYIEVPVQYTLLDGGLSVIPLLTAVDIVQTSEANIEMAIGLNVSLTTNSSVTLSHTHTHTHTSVRSVPYLV